MSEWCYIYPDELYHHGILGQKWGVRRYQNKDGTLTPLGKKRYRIDSEGNLVKKTREERKADARAAKSAKIEEQKRARLERENETLESKKARIRDSHDPQQIYANRDLFTTQELTEMYTRMNVERSISNLIPKEKERSYADTVQKLSNSISSTANLIESGTRAYNNFAKVSNTLSGTDMPIIGQEKISAEKRAFDKLKNENEKLGAKITNKKLKQQWKDMMKEEENRLKEAEDEKKKKEETTEN